MADTYLGIDFGTSGARAILIDSNGAQLHETRIGIDQKPNDVHLANTWQTALFELISQIPSNYRATIRSIAINGTSGTTLICNEHNQPLLPPLLYDDARAKDEADELGFIAPPDHIVLSASSSLAKLLWFSNQPEFKAARYFTHQADWLAAQLHGKPGLSDYHNTLKLGYDPANSCYPEWLLKQPVAPFLPKVVSPGTVLGNIQAFVAQQLALPADCHIAAGTTDSIAAFLASRLNQPGQAVSSLGSTLVLKLLSQARIDAAQYGIYSHRLGSLWLTGGASNTGGAVLRHFFDAAALKHLSAQINPAVASTLNYYPLLKPGERFPVNNPTLQPQLSPRPKEDVEFLHGLLESIARIEAQGYNLLEQLGANRLTQVLSAGGGAHNATWTAIRQRLLGVPVRASAHTEAAYGSALLAWQGQNLISSYT